MVKISKVPDRLECFTLPPAALEEIVGAWGWPSYRATQLLDWVYNKLVTDPALMTNFSQAQQRTLAERLKLVTSTVAAQQQSSDGTQKLLLAWPLNGAEAETVMIPDGDRRTACVSSQVGCPVGCRFCASGLNGVKASLTAGQIVEQVFLLNLLLKPAGSRITNVVFMGMGEPLANYRQVMQAVRILHDPQGFNIGARRITISTVGVPARMVELASEGLPINLAISLHAPNEPLRKQLIPWAEHFALEDILQAARHYFEKTGREVTLEYILLAGVNDLTEHAHQLARICKTIRANVNLIRFNEVPELPFVRPTSQSVVTFQQILRDSGVNAHVRKSRGRDIDAACGQLRRKQNQAVAAGLLK